MAEVGSSSATCKVWWKSRSSLRCHAGDGWWLPRPSYLRRAWQRPLRVAGRAFSQSPHALFRCHRGWTLGLRLRLGSQSLAGGARGEDENRNVAIGPIAAKARDDVERATPYQERSGALKGPSEGVFEAFVGLRRPSELILRPGDEAVERAGNEDGRLGQSRGCGAKDCVWKGNRGRSFGADSRGRRVVWMPRHGDDGRGRWFALRTHPRPRFSVRVAIRGSGSA